MAGDWQVVTSTIKTTYDIKITIFPTMALYDQGIRKDRKGPPKNHVRGEHSMNQFVFGIIIGAILVIVIVGVILTAYRLGQRSQYPTMLPSDEISSTNRTAAKTNNKDNQAEK